MLLPVVRIAAVIKVLRQLRVDQQRQAGAGQLRQRGLQFIGPGHGKPWKAGIDKEAFKPGDTRCRQGGKMWLVLSRQSTPGHPVYVALACGGFAFSFECSHGRGLRQAIERHIHERGIAAGRSGAGGGGEAFPFRSARFVHVHM